MGGFILYILKPCLQRVTYFALSALREGRRKEKGGRRKRRKDGEKVGCEEGEGITEKARGSKGKRSEKERQKQKRKRREVNEVEGGRTSE